MAFSKYARQCNCDNCQADRTEAWERAIYCAARALDRAGAKPGSRCTVDTNRLIQCIAEEVMIASGIEDDDLDEVLPGEEMQNAPGTASIQ